MSASRLPDACLSGQVHGPGGSGLPKNGHQGTWTLVSPTWSKYLKKSITWLSRHPARVMWGFWIRRYSKKVFQSRPFCDSYRPSGAGDEFRSDGAVANGPSPLFGSDLLCLDLPATDAKAIIKNLSVLAFWVIYMTVKSKHPSYFQELTTFSSLETRKETPSHSALKSPLTLSFLVG